MNNRILSLKNNEKFLQEISVQALYIYIYLNLINFLLNEQLTGDSKQKCNKICLFKFLFSIKIEYVH